MARGMTVKIEDTELLRDLQRLGVDVDKVLETALLAGAEVVQKAANQNAPGPHVEHGDVKKHGFNAEVDIGPDDEHWYYRYFETGARPHRIPTRPGLVRFIVRGDPIYARWVNHPGMSASPFLRPALDENEGKTRDAVGDKLKKVIDR